MDRALRRPAELTRRSVAVGLLTAAAGLALVLSVALALYDLGTFAWVDFETYVIAYHKVAAGLTPYASAQLEGPYRLDHMLRLGYAYPPPSALLFAPFALPYVGLALFTAMNVGLLLYGIFAVIRYERGTVSTLAVALVLASLAVYWPMAVGVASGNVNVGLAGLLALAWVRPVERRSGFAIAEALAAVIKVVPGVLVFWSSRDHGWPRFLFAAGTGVAIIMIAAPLTGVDMWGEYAVALANSRPICEGALHISIACLTAPVVGVSTGKLIGILVGVAAVLAMLLVRDRLFGYVLLVVAWLAPTTDFHEHTWLFVYVLALVGIIHLWSHARVRGSTSWRSGSPYSPPH